MDASPANAKKTINLSSAPLLIAELITPIKAALLIPETTPVIIAVKTMPGENLNKNLNKLITIISL